MSFNPQGPAGLPITVRESPNSHHDGNRIITGAIIHYTAGGFPGCLDWLTRSGSGVSAQYLINRPGVIHQLVPLGRVAWHAGRNWGRWNPNGWSAGYELVTPAHGPHDFTPEQMETLSRHLGWLFAEHNLTFAYPDGDPAGYRPKEYWSHVFADLGGWCCGHSAVNPNKPDPGKNFDWDLLEKRVKFYLAEHKKTAPGGTA